MSAYQKQRGNIERGYDMTIQLRTKIVIVVFRVRENYVNFVGSGLSWGRTGPYTGKLILFSFISDFRRVLNSLHASGAMFLRSSLSPFQSITALLISDSAHNTCSWQDLELNMFSGSILGLICEHCQS